MNSNTKRSIFRWIHIIFGLSIAAYIYGPPEETIKYISYFRFIYVPVIVLSGFWMWKGHVVSRLFAKK